jgi:hypothetical protein
MVASGAYCAATAVNQMIVPAVGVFESTEKPEPDEGLSGR